MLHVLLGIVALAIALGVIGIVSGGWNDDKAPRRPPQQEQRAPEVSGARADVEITGCTVPDDPPWPTAELRITNHSSKASDYRIEIEFVDAKGVRIAEGFAATNNLAPGQVARESATGFQDADAPVTCRITDVTRHASY